MKMMKCPQPLYLSTIIIICIAVLGCSRKTVNVPPPSPVKSKTLVYDCQLNVNYYFSSGKIYEVIRSELESEFTSANTNITWQTDETSLTTESIPWPQLSAYVANHRGPNTSALYLLSVWGFTQNPSRVLGVTRPNNVEGPNSWTVVFFGYLENFFSDPDSTSWVMNPCYGQIEELAGRISIHELGHQRAALPHTDSEPSEHDSGLLCVMTPSPILMGFVVNYDYCTNQDISPVVTPGDDPQYYSFCTKCKAKIAARTW